MKQLFIICLIILSTYASYKGIDTAGLVTFEQAKCMKSAGYSYAILRGYRSVGAIDKNGKKSIENASRAGLVASTYHFPCVGKVSPQQQAQDIVAYLKNYVNMYWIDIEYNPSKNCQWKTNDYSYNCHFLQELVREFERLHVQIGIYANHYQWVKIFGSAENCAHFQKYPLWYPHYNNVQNFDKFLKFGGWTAPLIKQYTADKTVCGVGADLNLSYHYPYLESIEQTIN